MEIPAKIVMSSGTHSYYIAVKASLHSSDTAVFGLNDEEEIALAKRFEDYKKEVINGILLKTPPIDLINALSELGYKVVCTTGEAEIVWTMKRDI
ncbi:uncharacterized protein LOC112903856 [Agrilus planipennis]|uniref:Uncharacterized protein LOC112903856 n=1 Tax=Agrilus planipennis TaxID=224129 RepID=A0A1W4WZS8_AGRPL|nr:uncharacterized protein LOC112903856 [Agrilus planipennis]